MGRFTCYPRRSESTACGAEFACAMAAMEACTRTCALVRLAASDATSVSRIRDSAAENPEICDCARLMAYCSLFWPAPILPCTEPRFVTALPNAVIALIALAVAEDP